MARVTMINRPGDYPGTPDAATSADLTALFAALFPGNPDPRINNLHAGVAIAAHTPKLALALTRLSGLIANELVTNAAKHGAGKIKVTFSASGKTNRLIVCDEGRGLIDGFDPHAATAGLGMRVIMTLVKQLEGTLDADPREDGCGACFTVRFPRG